MKILEVIDTTTAYSSTPKNDEGERLPLGAIKVRSAGGGGKKNTNDEFAIPLGPVKRIPLVGEHVMTFRGPSWSADPGDNPERAYYLTSCNVQDNLNLGILPQTFLRGRNNPIGQLSDFLNSLGNPQKETALDPFLGQTFQERETIKPVQPYEGDTLIEGRWGQTIRMTSTIEDSPHPDATEGKDVYEIPGCSDWEGGVFGAGSPIMFITNGHFPIPGPNRYSKESFELDKSTICMTSGQKLKTFETAQPNLGIGVPRSNKADTSQVVITSDRLVFNAKREYLILAAKRSVQVATPNWAADMNEVLTIMDELLNIMQRITSASSPYPTTPGIGNGPTLANPEAGAVAALVSRMSRLKQ